MDLRGVVLATVTPTSDKKRIYRGRGAVYGYSDNACGHMVTRSWPGRNRHQLSVVTSATTLVAPANR